MTPGITLLKSTSNSYIRKHRQESLEVALVESVGELLCQGWEFIHAHGLCLL
jgi:hypothetical protein